MNEKQTDIYDLGIMLKNINAGFSMNEFNDRLILQKTIYVLKSFGIDFGYQYSWYLHGVYSPDLTRDGFKLEEIYHDIPNFTLRYASDKTQAQFEKFLTFMKDKKSNPDLLEIVSSICHLNPTESNKNLIIKFVEDKKPRFTKQQCEQMWEELEQYEVISR